MMELLCTATLVLSLLCACAQVENECGDKPADVVFILDSSGSIWAPDFQKQLDFVKGVTNIFDTSPEAMQVGVLSFSNWAYVDFHLNGHKSKEDIQSAVGEILQIRGDTDTAGALALARQEMFKPENGAREGVPHIVIILTDGRSNVPEETAAQAILAHRAGIHVFAIGIGYRVDKEELKQIASDPDDQFVFEVNDYSALDQIKDLLAIKTCQVTDPPRLPLPPPKPNVPQLDQACGNAAMADIIFATSANGSPEHTDKALEFYRDIAGGLEIGEDKVHIGLIPRECRILPELYLNEFQHKDEALQMLEELEGAQSSTAKVLKYMHKMSFNPKNGARARAKKIGVLMVDDGHESLAMAVKEAAKVKTVQDVELFVIGVGKGLDMDQLRGLATSPVQQHVFQVASYEDLDQLVPQVASSICPVPSF